MSQYLTELLLNYYDRNRDYAQRLTADLADAQWTVQPAANTNHAAWVIGHLAHVADRVAGPLVLGGVATLPADWGQKFGGKSTPVADRAAYPSKDQLWQAYVEGHARVTTAVSALDEAALKQPPAHEHFRTRFPTVAAALLHTMVGHEMQHLGQLSAWRRVQGLPSV